MGLVYTRVFTKQQLGFYFHSQLFPFFINNFS